MIRIYCDTNIYQYLKPEHAGFDMGLKETFEALKGKMLFTFSDAHIDDVRDTPKSYAEADMLSMGEYVNDNYFMHDMITEKATGPYLATPIEVYRGKDFDAFNRTLDNPFDIDKLLDDIEGGEELNALKDLTKALFDIPIAAFNPAILTTSVSTTPNQFLNKFSPNYDPMMSLGSFMNDIWPYSKSLLGDKKEVAELRRFIASYMKREEYSFENWGNQFNERFRNSNVGKSFLEMVDGTLGDNEKQDLHARFTRAYVFLELYNITQERSSGKLKQSPLQSLNTDASHAWYASFSDYLITNDKGLQVKAAILYHLFEFHTKILSPQDFINSKNQFLSREETFEKFSAALSYDFEHSFQLYYKEDLLQTHKVTTYKPNHHYFNYFNRYQVIRSEAPTLCVLYCERESHADFFMYREGEIMVNKLLDMLGMDDEGKGKCGIEERFDDGENIRTWKRGTIEFSLRTSSVSWGTLLCLCLTFPKRN